MPTSPPRRVPSLAFLGALGIALVTIGLLNASPSSERGRARPERPLRIGVVDPATFEAHGPLAFARIRAAGATFARVIVSWRSIAPSQEPEEWAPQDPADPHYAWGPTDKVVREIARAGLEPVVAVLYTPSWAKAFEQCRKGKMCAPDPKDYGRFARAAARRYSGRAPGLPRVRYWQAWNEPNLSYFLLPQRRGSFDVAQKGDARFISPYIYRGLVNAFAAGVKGVFQSNLVIAGGTQPWVAQYAVPALAFMRAMLCMEGRRDPQPKESCGARSRFDIWSTHPYTNGPPNYDYPGPAFRDDVSIPELPLMERLLRAAESAGHIRTSRSRVEFWVDEFSWDSKPPDPHGVPWGLQARWTANALYRMWRAGISTVIWFQLRDDPDYGRPHGLVYESGLYLRGRRWAADRPKRVLRVLEFPFVAFRRPAGIYVWGRTPDSKSEQVSIQLRGPDRWERVGELRADRFGIFQGQIPASSSPGDRVRAEVRSGTSVPYPMKPFKVFYHPPFGIPPGS
jgi:hypothetical protein